MNQGSSFTTSANATSWSANSLTADTKYYFWVEAYNDNGSSSSVTTNATTQTSSSSSSSGGCTSVSVTNGGFESGSLSGWTGGTLNTGTANIRTGTYSGYLKRNQTMTQTLSGLSSSTQYTVNAYVYKATNENAVLQVSDFGGTTVSSSVKPGAVWTLVSVSFTTGSSNTSATLTLTRQNTSYDYIYWDRFG